MYTSTTRNLTVSVEPAYLASESVPEKNLYVFSYTVRIENNGSETVQLRHRYWKITDGYGRNQEVRGEGVIGKEPVLKPGDHFEYTSGTPLPTPTGIMVGTYSMQDASGGMFDIDIPAFSLDAPNTQRNLN